MHVLAPRSTNPFENFLTNQFIFLIYICQPCVTDPHHLPRANVKKTLPVAKLKNRRRRRKERLTFQSFLPVFELNVFA
jgi:hypothetical protein